MEHLNTTKTTISYKLQDVEKLTPAVINKVKWPKVIKFLCFEPGGGTMRMDKPLMLGVPWHKFSGGVIFLQKRDALTAAPGTSGNGLRLKTIKSKKMLRSVYVGSQDHYYDVEWKGLLGKHMLEERESFNKEVLPRVTAAAVFRGEKPVGVVGGIKHRVKFINKTVWFITWIWIDPAQRQSVRHAVRAKLVGWLRHRPIKHLCAHVNTFNIPSQKFWLKQGFRPVRVLFYERDGLGAARN